MSIQLAVIVKTITFKTGLTKSAGSSLVEVMVSLLVLAIGLMGVMSMQTNGLNSNQRATFLSEAQIAAQDMVERIYAYESLNADLSLDSNNFDNIDTRNSIESSCSSSVSGCAYENTPSNDAYQWRQLFDRDNDSGLSLPGAYGKVEWNELEEAYFVTVYWDQDRQGGSLSEFQSPDDPTSCNSSNKQSYLTCYRLVVRP